MAATANKQSLDALVRCQLRLSWCRHNNFVVFFFDFVSFTYILLANKPSNTNANFKNCLVTICKSHHLSVYNNNNNNGYDDNIGFL